MPNQADSKPNQGVSVPNQADLKRNQADTKKKRKKGKTEAEAVFVSQVFPDASDVWQELFRQAAKEFPED